MNAAVLSQSDRREAGFWDRIADKYAARPVMDPEAYERKLALTRQYLTPESVVLEFGCGTGSTALKLADAVKEIHASDFSQPMIAIAKAKTFDAGVGNVHFRQSTIFDTSFGDESFDAVLGHSILHLLADKDAAIRRVHQLLKPGGVFVSSTACLGETMGWFRYVAPIGRFFGRWPLVKVFKIDDLVASVERQGFTIEQKYVPEKSRMVCFLIARKEP